MCLPTTAEPAQIPARAAQRAPSASLDFRTMLTWGHVASPLNETYCLKLVPQVRFLPSGSERHWQSHCSGSQGLCGPRLLMSGRAQCQVISDAPGVQNQLIHQLRDPLRVRLLGPGQRTSESSLQVGPGRAGGDRVNFSLALGQ